MQCFPLYSVLKAAGMTRLDYLSLDLEATKLEASAECEKPMLGQEIQELFYRLWNHCHGKRLTSRWSVWQLSEANMMTALKIPKLISVMIWWTTWTHKDMSWYVSNHPLGNRSITGFILFKSRCNLAIGSRIGYGPFSNLLWTQISGSIKYKYFNTKYPFTF